MFKTGDIVQASASTVPFLTHYGIVTVEKEGTFILHNSALNGITKELMESFATKRKIRDVYPSGMTDLDLILERFENACHKDYNVFTFNCEHFIYCMLGEKMKSPQLQSGIMIGGLGLIYYFLNK